MIVNLLNLISNIREKKYILCLLITFLLICTLLTGCSDTNQKKGTLATDFEGIKIEFINVGKGDCAVIHTKDYVFLIDTGYKETVEDVKKYLHSQGIKKIDGMIITHYDKDHIGGATEIIDEFDVLAIYGPDYVDEGNKYAKFMKYLEKNGKRYLLNYIKEETIIEGENISITIYPGEKTHYEKENDYSLVTKVIYGQDSFLFTGDVEEEHINELLGRDFLKADVLKFPYHGELLMNNIELLDEVSPKYVVITPESEEKVSTSIIYEMEEIGSKYYFNCQGNVHCTSDGKGNIVVEQG